MIDRLDLDRHIVLEASAGTGKTHALGDIVLRLLVEGRCDIEQLLLVTFTEKATGELKDRLRHRLEQAIDQSPDHAAALRPHLDRFDRAAISTIHGFCHRVLHDHAADLGQDFQTELADDAILRREALRDVQRKDWPKEFGPRLRDVMTLSGYDRDSAGKWDRQALSLASRYRPECGHRLVPDPPLEEHELLNDTVRKIGERTNELKRQRGLISFDDIIERVALGLDPAVNPRATVVLAALREQYRFAIVDEFQDTDVLQWAIFRRVFLESETSRLIVVGDPKQAIYFFRGADLPTYLTAVREMREERNAVAAPLGTNWRSTPELIAGLNRLFGAGEYFPPAEGIEYAPVEAAPETLRRSRLTRDDSGRPAITIVDVDAPEKMSESRSGYARFVALEIERLLTGDDGRPLIEMATPTGSRPINAADICLLTQTRPEAREFTAALRRRRIPYSFYKSGNVRSTTEATDIGRVLRALAHPDDESLAARALLTCFFRVPPVELMADAAPSTDQPARLLLRKWRVLAGQRQWGDLFASMFEETGVLFRDRDQPDYDRRLANLRLLFGRLQSAAYGRNLDLLELLDLHESTRAAAEGDSDDQPMETDEPRVRLMTMHAAKGLEFPIVFLTGKFGDEKSNGDSITYRDDDGRLVFDMTLLDSEARKAPEFAERLARQRLDESRRLYYVALTRPRFKLYVPLMSEKGHAKQAPIVTLIRPAIERSRLGEAAGIATVVDGLGELPTPTKPKLAAPAAATSPLAPVPVHIDSVLPTFDAAMSRRRVVVQSFTGLNRHSRREQRPAFGDRPERGDEVHDPVVESADVFRGPVFGEMVHEIFETVDIPEVAAAKRGDDLAEGSTGRLIDSSVERFLPRLTSRGPDEAMAAECRRTLRDMVWKAFHTPLTPLGGRLAQLRPGDCLREIEFLYPRSPEGEEERFVTGYVDLVFRWRGLVYLLDWKTNVLPAYDRASLEAGMAEANYSLQYRLYWDALIRWLGSLPAGKRPGLGGVFYVFLRGLTGVDDSGVFFVPARELGRG